MRQILSWTAVFGTLLLDWRPGLASWVALSMLLLVTGCASNPAAPSPWPTPGELSASADPSFKGKRITWGGAIVGRKNLSDTTLVEIMAYPLDSSGRPLTEHSSQGRFLMDYSGFLEPEEYKPGRLLTVTGAMLGFTDGKVGGAPYRYPALRGDQLKLWPLQMQKLKIRPHINVGIGVGSGGYGGVGVGIGF